MLFQIWYMYFQLSDRSLLVFFLLDVIEKSSANKFVQMSASFSLTLVQIISGLVVEYCSMNICILLLTWLYKHINIQGT